MNADDTKVSVRRPAQRVRFAEAKLLLVVVAGMLILALAASGADVMAALGQW